MDGANGEMSMREDDARAFELVRAFEMEDSEATLLTREDRAQADAAARQAAAGASGKRADRAFLATRARFAAARLTTRHPGIAGLLSRSRWPRWVGVVLPLAALVLGVAANELGHGKRMDLLAVPLLGTIAWNLLVYLSLPVVAVKGMGKPRSDPVSRVVSWIAGIARRDFDRGTHLARAADTFQRRWSSLSAPLAGARIARTLHLSAAMFAAGIIAGIYLRALVVEYRAGWESTFLGPDAVHSLLSTILGPAMALTGVDLPPAADFPALRWSNGDGIIAGPIIHLWTATLAGAVIVPRLALALWQGLREARLSRAMPIAGREDFYTRRLLRSAGGEPGRVQVTPYAYTPDQTTKAALVDALGRALGDGAQVTIDAPVAYGEEEKWLAAHPPDPGVDYRVLLFSIAATPENENHGEFASIVAKAMPAGTMLTALVDEGPFRERFARQAGFDERIDGRSAAWRSVLAEAGLVPLSLDLSDSDTDALAERLEGGLLPDAELRR